MKFGRSLTNGHRFEKSYTYLDGAIIVTFRSPSKLEIDLIMAQLEYDRRGGISATQLKRLSQDYQLICYLQSLCIDGSTLVFPEADSLLSQSKLPCATLPELRSRLASVSEPLYNVLCASMEAFKNLIISLSSEFMPARNRVEAFVEHVKAWEKRRKNEAGCKTTIR